MTASGSSMAAKYQLFGHKKLDSCLLNDHSPPRRTVAETCGTIFGGPAVGYISVAMLGYKPSKDTSPHRQECYVICCFSYSELNAL